MGLDVEVMYRMYGHSVLRRARQILANDDEAREVLQEIGELRVTGSVSALAGCHVRRIVLHKREAP